MQELKKGEPTGPDKSRPESFKPLGKSYTDELIHKAIFLNILSSKLSYEFWPFPQVVL